MRLASEYNHIFLKEELANEETQLRNSYIKYVKNYLVENKIVELDNRDLHKINSTFNPSVINEGMSGKGKMPELKRYEIERLMDDNFGKKSQYIKLITEYININNLTDLDVDDIAAINQYIEDSISKNNKINQEGEKVKLFNKFKDRYYTSLKDIMEADVLRAGNVFMATHTNKLGKKEIVPSTIHVILHERRYRGSTYVTVSKLSSYNDGKGYEMSRREPSAEYNINDQNDINKLARNFEFGTILVGAANLPKAKRANMKAMNPYKYMPYIEEFINKFLKDNNIANKVFEQSNKLSTLLYKHV